MQRRSFLQASGAGVATLGLGSLLDVDDPAGDGFSAVDVPIADTLIDVAQTDAGPVAVGADGQILHRGVDGWSVVEDQGITGEGNTLNAAAATNQGEAVWICGDSGAVGFYDPTADQLRDFSRPHGETADWSAVVVHGRMHDVTVVLGDASGNVVVGGCEPCEGMSWSPPRQPTGGAITAIERCGYEQYRVVDAEGRVAESTDGGESWTTLGAPDTGSGFADLSAVFARNTSAVGAGVVVDYDPYAPASDRWTVHEVGGGAIHDVERETEDDGVAVGADGRFFERADGSWTERSLDTDATLRAIARSDEDFPDVIVGAGGTVLERGRYTAHPYGIEMRYDRDETLQYRFTVDGHADLWEHADDATTVQHEDGVATVEGTIDDGERREGFAYAGDLTDVEVFEGDAEELYMDARDEFSVGPAQFAAQEWTTTETPTAETLRGVADSAAGPVAVGDDGHVLARRGGSWETVTDSGPSGNGNSLRAAASTEAGGMVWFAGDSGSLGWYDPDSGEITDHSAPGGLTDSLTALLVGGSPEDAAVWLGTDSGQFLYGRYEAGEMTWREPVTPASGASIVGFDYVVAPTGNTGWTVCDTNGDLATSDDFGQTWEVTSIPGLDGTPQAFGSRDVADPAVVCDDGSVVTYDEETWTTRKRSANALYAVGEADDRFLTAGDGTVHSDRLAGWETVFDGGAAIHDIVAFSGQNELAVAVGADGTVSEQRLRSEPYGSD